MRIKISEIDYNNELINNSTNNLVNSHQEVFNQFRVRAHNDIARIEVGKDEIYKFFNEDLLNKTDKKLKEIGFKYVTLDMAGYEMGSMNK